MKKLLFLLLALTVSAPAFAQTQTQYYTVPTIAALKAMTTSRPAVVQVVDSNPGIFNLSSGACSAADDVFQVQPTAGTTVCYTRAATPLAVGKTSPVSSVMIGGATGTPAFSTTLPSNLTITTQAFISGAAGTTRTLGFNTAGVSRWTVSALSTAETGNNTGSPFLIFGYTDAGTSKGTLLRGERGSGPYNNGNVYISTIPAMFSSAIRGTTPGGIIGDERRPANSNQPTSTLLINPISTQNGSATVTVTWATCCGASNNSIDITTYPTYVNIGGATAVGGITLSGWYKVQSIVDDNTFTVTASGVASSTATGGGAAVTVEPDFAVYHNRAAINWTGGAEGFYLNRGNIQYANPRNYIALPGAGPIYQNEWSVSVSPPDTSLLNYWAVTGRELDVVNRGANKGYYATRFTTPNLTEADQIVAFNALLGASGGGTPTHVDFGYSCNGHQVPTRFYHCFAISPNSLVGGPQDTVASHGGVGHDDYGSYTYLGSNPFRTTIGTSTITVTAGAGNVAGLSFRSNGDSIYLPMSYTISGVTFGTGSYTIANLTSTTFDITGTGVAAATVSGGGSEQALFFATDVPYAHTQISGQWAHGIITSPFSKFDDGLLISTQAGNGMGWSTTPGTASINAVLASGNITLTPASGGIVSMSSGASVTGQITSTLATGTAPFVVASTTNVVNLNASSLNGATFASPGAIGATTPSTITATSGTFTGVLGVADGTSALPSLVFTSEPTTGFYRRSAAIISLVTLTVPRWEFSGAIRGRSDGLIGFSSGSSLASADTAISRISAGIMGFGTGAGGSIAGGISLASVLASGTITGATINATTAYQANGTPGVNCTVGTFNPATAVVTKGIITTC